MSHPAPRNRESSRAPQRLVRCPGRARSEVREARRRPRSPRCCSRDSQFPRKRVAPVGRCLLDDVHHNCQRDGDGYAGQHAAPKCLGLAVRRQGWFRSRPTWRGPARCGRCLVARRGLLLVHRANVPFRMPSVQSLRPRPLHGADASISDRSVRRPGSLDLQLIVVRVVHLATLQSSFW